MNNKVTTLPEKGGSSCIDMILLGRRSLDLVHLEYCFGVMQSVFRENAPINKEAGSF